MRERVRSMALSTREELHLFRRLFSFTGPYRAQLFASWFATAGYAAFGALLVGRVKPIFDKALILQQDVATLSATIVVLYLAKGICSYFSTTLVAAAGQQAVTDLRNQLYRHILKQSFSFLGRSTTGSLMSHITTDVEKIQAAVSELAGDLLKEGLTIVGLLVVLFYMDYRLALLSMIGLPAVVDPLVRLGRRLRASNETSLRRWKDITEILQETISGFRVVKVLPAGAVILTEGPSDFIDNQPYVTVSIGTGSPEQADERAKFARNLLSSTPMRDLSLRSADAMRIGGAPGFEIRAQAKGPDNEILTVVQWVRFGSGGYLRIVGVCRQENWDALFTRFRAVRDGIDRR